MKLLREGCSWRRTQRALGNGVRDKQRKGIKTSLGSPVVPGGTSTHISVTGCDIPSQARDGQRRAQREGGVLPKAAGRADKA